MNHIGETNKMISDTPRLVDQIFLSEKNDWTADLYRVGCDLQRELNAANAIIRQQQLLEEENLRLQERIKRLEEAGDMLEHNNGAMAQQAWRKAKEAKP